ncbi:MAG: putative bifunctional diguanylate cyclase/phosphodiesterase [Acidimicrobiales bacterium]
MSRRIDRTLILSCATGFMLVVLAVSTAFTSGRTDAISHVDDELSQEAGHRSDDIEVFFERARTITLISAKNAAFSQFFAEDHSTAQAAAPNVVDALGYLEKLYPGRIGEACFINLDGAEHARVVHNQAALPEDLSLDEAENPFFAPTVAMAMGEVYHAAPYYSPDTLEWVISNSTLVADPAGVKQAMLHYEITLSSFIDQLGSPNHTVAIVDRNSGLVIGRPAGSNVSSGAIAIQDDPRFAVLTHSNSASHATINGQRFAAAPVSASPNNANNWMVVVGTQDPVGPFVGFDAAHLGLALVGTLLVVASFLTHSGQQARLRQALSDALTGLPNRRRLLQEGDQRLTAIREGSPGADTMRTANGSREDSTAQAAMLMIDLDRFKEINDTLGHAEGDEVLRQVAGRLAEAVGPQHLLCRLGGDEFSVLLSGPISTTTALSLARSLHDVISLPILLKGLPVQVGASVGVAFAPQHGRDVGALLQHADVAMYESKHASKGVTVYDPDRDPYSPARLDQAAEFRAAVASGLPIELHFQPKVQLSTGHTTGLEVLARWCGPDGQMVHPDEFIPLAERSGQLMALTTLVLDRALAQLALWRAEGFAVSVAVNVSPSSLLEGGFVAQVADNLHRHGVPGRALMIELTETAVMKDPERSLRVLAELRRIGVNLSIDDFGTGYSSLSYLRRFPVSELKIDRSFVTTLSSTGADDAIVQAAVQLGQSLGLQVVAEGVEDQAALDRLRDLGCDQVQGFLLSPPLAAPDATQWLRANPVPRMVSTVVSPADPSSLDQLDGLTR